MGTGFGVRRKRLYFLDNLKWFIIWLMVVFHAALCYMAYAPEWWYVVDDAQPVFSATVFVSWADVFIMPVMFFISGYFGLMSLAKHRMGEFWRGKMSRIILPWVFGSMLIAPPVTYIMLASRHSPMGFYEFYTTLFWGVLYEQAQYWYLGALVALYLMLAAICKLFPGFRERGVARRPGASFFVFLFAASIMGIGLVSFRMHPDTWVFYAYLLVLQPVRVPLYILVFFAGALAWRQQWFSAGGYVPGCWNWLAAFVAMSLLYLWQKFSLPYDGRVAPMALIWANAVCQGSLALSALFFLLGFFHRFADCTTPLLADLSATSYAVYYVHMPIVFCLAWGFVGVGLNVYIKYACVSALALWICFLLSKWVMLRIPSFSVK